MALRELLHKMFVGKIGHQCSECGSPVRAGEGYHVSFMVFCDEEHAVQWQAFQVP